jgi:stage V sporulation protein AE
MEILINLIKAFLVGGGFCLIGQILVDYTKLTPARILTGFVVLGVVLSAVGIYGPLVDFAGAGATVPLTGFGHLLAEGVKKAVDEFGIIGVLSGGISAAATGLGAVIVFGFIAALIFRSGDKN